MKLASSAAMLGGFKSNTNGQNMHYESDCENMNDIDMKFIVEFKKDELINVQSRTTCKKPTSMFSWTSFVRWRDGEDRTRTYNFISKTIDKSLEITEKKLSSLNMCDHKVVPRRIADIIKSITSIQNLIHTYSKDDDQIYRCRLKSLKCNIQLRLIALQEKFPQFFPPVHEYYPTFLDSDWDLEFQYPYPQKTVLNKVVSPLSNVNTSCSDKNTEIHPSSVHRTSDFSVNSDSKGPNGWDLNRFPHANPITIIKNSHHVSSPNNPHTPNTFTTSSFPSSYHTPPMDTTTDTTGIKIGYKPVTPEPMSYIHSLLSSLSTTIQSMNPQPNTSSSSLSFAPLTISSPHSITPISQSKLGFKESDLYRPQQIGPVLRDDRIVNSREQMIPSLSNSEVNYIPHTNLRADDPMVVDSVSVTENKSTDVASTQSVDDRDHDSNESPKCENENDNTVKEKKIYDAEKSLQEANNNLHSSNQKKNSFDSYIEKYGKHVFVPKKSVKVLF